MRQIALVVGGGDRQHGVALALHRRGMDAVFVDDVIGAMAALGRAPFRSLVVLSEQRNAAMPLRALLRVARHRHPEIGLVLLRAPGRTREIAAPLAEELALDATDEDVAAAAIEAPGPPTLDEKTAPQPLASADALLEGTLAGAGGPAVLASLFAQELTGRLHVDDGPARGILYFAGGEPVAVDAENPRSDPRGANEVLAELRGLVRARVLALIEQPSGAYSFFEDQGFLDVRLLTKVSPFGLILDVRRKNTTPASLLSLQAEMAQKFVTPGVGLERAGKRLGAFTRDKNIAEVVGSSTTVESVLNTLGLDPLMGTLVMLTLVDARLIALHDTPPGASMVALGEIDAAPNPFTLGDNSVMVTEGEAEQIARLYVEMKPATDPRVVLGVGNDASPAEIEEAYRSRMAALHRDGAGVDQRLDELRRKADQARASLLETVPTERAAKTETIGRYEIVKRIGQGGMAEVFLGRQVGLHGFEKRVVIKRILPQWADDLDVVRMFLEEARIAARITHPNVVQIYDLGESNGQYYIVMEHVDGPNFDKLIESANKKDVAVPFEIAATVVAQACAGLHAAHAHKDDFGRVVPIIHRDVSTQNILVASDGHVKLTDFGVAKRADALDRTSPGILKGKPHYLAPEYIQGAPADARSDVFAAGLVLYVALTGVHPFERMTPDESMRAVLASSYPTVDKLRTDIPKALANVVARALAVRVEQRFQTAHALQLALESFTAATGTMTTPSALADFVELAGGSRPRITSVPDAAPVADPAQAGFEEKTLELVWPFAR